jgi:hypothetical protein
MSVERTVNRKGYTSILTLTANATGPKVSLNFKPWYPSEGSVKPGNLPERAQSNLPSNMLSGQIAEGYQGEKSTGVDDHTTNSSTMSADPLRSTMHYKYLSIHQPKKYGIDITDR